MKHILLVSIFLILFVQCSIGQSLYKYHFEQVKFSDIDSLASDSLVLNEFKILNYCYCQYYLKIEQVKAFNRGIKKKSVLKAFPDKEDYAYYDGGHQFSSHSYESKRSFFRYNLIEIADFKELIKKYYTPIVEYIKNTDDLKRMDGYSPMFECFYAVEKMPLEKELKNFLLSKQDSLRFFIIEKNDIIYDFIF